MEGKFIVLGCNRFEGTIDGTHYSQSKVRCLGIPKPGENEKGLTQIIMLGGYDLFDEIKLFPAVYNIDFEQTTKGNLIYSMKAEGEAIKLPLKFRGLDNK